VEAGKNTSTVILASRKRRRKGNPVVSDETVMYGYESSATLTTDRLHYKLQSRPLVREGAPSRRAKQLSGKRKGGGNLVMGPKGVSDTKTDRLTDSGQRNRFLRPYSRFSRLQPPLFLPSSSSFVLTRLSGPRSRPTTSRKIW
jgi:hypothetical protein